MGDLTIKVLSGHNLIASDRNGKSDPYVTLEVIEDPTQRKQKTKIVHKNLNPIWNQAFMMKALAPTNTILFKVWDHDTFSRDDPLGNVSVSVSRLTPHSPNPLMLDLQGVQRGKISVEITYRPYNSPQTNPPAPYSSAQQQVYPPPSPQTSGYPPHMSNSGVYPPPHMSNSGAVYPPPSSAHNSYNNIQPQPYSYPQGQSPFMVADPRTQSQPQQNGVYPPPSPYQSGGYPPPQNGPYPPQQMNNPYPPPQNNGAYPPPQNNGSYPPPTTASNQIPYMSQPGGSYPPPSAPVPSSDYPHLFPPGGDNIQNTFNTIPPTPPSDPSAPPLVNGSSINLTKSGRASSQMTMNQQAPPPNTYSGPYPPQPTLQTGPYPTPLQSSVGFGAPPPSSSSFGGYSQPVIVNAQGLIQQPVVPLTKFFVDVKKRLQRDYIIIMDRSGSMSGARWRQAQQACMQLAPFACQADPDGITLYLFNDNYKRYDNLKTAHQVEAIFKREAPSGTTAMDKVLHAAFHEHFTTMKPTTILMITDGEPDSKHKVFEEIMRAASRMQTLEELSISFIQIGDDRLATHFLQELDDNMVSRGARFDMVDTLSAKDIGKMSFDQLIQKSIYD